MCDIKRRFGVVTHFESELHCALVVCPETWTASKLAEATRKYKAGMMASRPRTGETKEKRAMSGWEKKGRSESLVR